MTAPRLYGSGAWWRLPEIGNTSTRCRPAMEGTRSAYADPVGCYSTHTRSANGARTAGARIHGHWATFGRWARISDRSGDYVERIAPGAFTDTIQRDGDRIKCCFQHGRDPQVGDKPIAVLDVLREDDIGGYYEGEVLDGLPPLLLNGLKAGVYGASFRFKVNQQRIVDRPGRSDWNPRGLPERTITGASVRELGPVTYGAYSSATSKVTAHPAPLALVSSTPRSARLGRTTTRPSPWVLPTPTTTRR